MSILGRLKDLRFELFYGLVSSRHASLATHGTVCPWTFDDQKLTAKSNVLCAGAGNDISFEKSVLALVERVVLLDPSPTGIATVHHESLPPAKLDFHPIGLAGHDGELAFAEPADATEGSYRAAGEGTKSIRFPCERLSTAMAAQGWNHIDLLKMDIEGCEYDVLDDVLTEHLDVRQICVEFHHGPKFARGRMDTVRAILNLRRAGYRLVHRHHWDHTFIRIPLVG